MSQPAAPGIQPALSELDTPPEDKKSSTPEEDLNKNPTNTPSPKTEDKSADGEPKPEDKKPEDINTDTDDQPDTDDAADSDDPMSFWNEVNKLRGDDMKWEFPQDVDPLTPQGIHHAIKVAADREVALFEQSIMQSDPVAYAYMLHRANGGSDEQFFATKREVLPDFEVLKESVDLQQAFYKRSLTAKGILPEQADLIVKDAIDKNKLPVLVEAEYKARQEQDKKQLEELIRIDRENQQREQQYIQRMGTILQEKIIENKGLNITIPDAKRAEFLQAVNNLILFDRDSGRFFINQEITNDNLPQILESLYYMHVKGNMDEIINNKASQKNVQRVRLKMQQDKTKKSTQADPTKKQDRPGVQPAVSEL